MNPDSNDGTDRKSGLIRLDFYFCVEYNLLAVLNRSGTYTILYTEGIRCKSGAMPSP